MNEPTARTKWSDQDRSWEYEAQHQICGSCSPKGMNCASDCLCVCHGPEAKLADTIPNQAERFNEFADWYWRESQNDVIKVFATRGLADAIRAAQAAAYQKGIADAQVSTSPAEAGEAR